MQKLTYTADASTAFVAGALLYRDTSSGELKTATGAAGTTLNIEAVSSDTVTTPASYPTIEAHPVISGAQQLWIADCTSNTAADQLNKAHALTDGLTVANTSTHIATTLGVFVALGIVGAASDKKLLGYFVKVGQVTA
jgi:hypothetical protein